MKRILIKDIEKHSKKGKIRIIGWIENKKDFGKIIILRIRDMSGIISAVAKLNIIEKRSFLEIKKLKEEACIEILGEYDRKNREFLVEKVKLISPSIIRVSPKPSQNFDVFSERYSDILNKYRHVYIRKKEIRSILKIRSIVHNLLHKFLQKKNFTEFVAPIISPITLYGEKTAFCINYFGTKSYLTQCTAFYLESALPIFERVYSISPSFRREQSKSKRHLAEYWHLKAEAAFFDFSDIISLAEEMIYFVVKELTRIGKRDSTINAYTEKIDRKYYKPPYKSITYEEAIEILQDNDYDIEFGKSLGSDEEEFLGKLMKKPFWVKFLPRSVEPFPYRINPIDERTTLTADLIFPFFGEILGVAEKIYKKDELERRMLEDFVPHSKENYWWYIELRDLGMPPHSGIGMGIERLIRAILNLPHVKYVLPYPRLPNKPIYI